MGGAFRVGVSGWSYPSWRGDFYPSGLRQADELAHLSSRLSTAEINGSFYALQRPSSYRRWREATPEGFIFSVKGGRYITHYKRLRDASQPLANFFASGVTLLSTKLGPFLWQLPEHVAFDPPTVADFLDLLPTSAAEAAALAAQHDRPTETTAVSTDFDGSLRHALEVRHQSFRDDAFFALLEQHGAACVVADSAGRWPQLDHTTAAFEYVRLHGHAELYASRYPDDALALWADRCRRAVSDGRDVYVYFDNDARGHAPHDALRLDAMLRGQ